MTTIAEKGKKKYTGECMHAKSLQSCPILCDSVDCSLSGSSVHEILQVRILEGLLCPSPGDLPHPGVESRSPALQEDSLLSEPPGKSLVSGLGFKSQQLASQSGSQTADCNCGFANAGVLGTVYR